MTSRKTPPMKIAVVGSGISGLSSAWLLNQHHEVTLFERDERLGGHTNTVDIDSSVGRIPVDTGFIVFNERCYPNLIALFQTLGVAWQSTDMSFGVSLDKGRLEYSGSDSITTLFAQKRNILRPRFWKMLADLLRFYRQSEGWLQSLPDDLSLGELLDREKFGAGFRDDHLLPMGAAIWSTPADKMLAYPARAFLRFCDNHGLLQVNDRPRWQTVVGGSRSYVERIAGTLSDIRLNCGIEKIHRRSDGVSLFDCHGAEHHFDHVVLASHADQSLAMLGDASALEQSLLGAFGYEWNEALLHSDEALMPRRKAAWSSWNYLSDPRSAQQKVSVSYWMNSLQHLPCPEPVIVTLNPLQAAQADKIYGRFHYQHPVFDEAAMAAQRKLWAIQGQQRTWFCGSFMGYGFHEDGIQAGLAVAERLGGTPRPWAFDTRQSRIALPDDDAQAA